MEKSPASVLASVVGGSRTPSCEDYTNAPIRNNRISTEEVDEERALSSSGGDIAAAADYDGDVAAGSLHSLDSDPHLCKPAGRRPAELALLLIVGAVAVALFLFGNIRNGSRVSDPAVTTALELESAIEKHHEDKVNKHHAHHDAHAQHVQEKQAENKHHAHRHEHAQHVQPKEHAENKHHGHHDAHSKGQNKHHDNAQEHAQYAHSNGHHGNGSTGGGLEVRIAPSALEATTSPDPDSGDGRMTTFVKFDLSALPDDGVGVAAAALVLDLSGDDAAPLAIDVDALPRAGDWTEGVRAWDNGAAGSGGAVRIGSFVAGWSAPSGATGRVYEVDVTLAVRMSTVHMSAGRITFMVSTGPDEGHQRWGDGGLEMELVIALST